MGLLVFLLKYKLVILFYLGVIAFLYYRRKQVTVQSKIFVLYRSVFGIKFIDKISKKFGKPIRFLGYIGIGVGFIGLVLISFFLISNLFTLFSQPEQPSGVALVLPGVEIPGLGVLPFWHWIIAIFMIAVIHEFAHGIVARSHGLKVKWTGLVLIGPIIGAFVEPDEKKLLRGKDAVQHSVYAAGAFANILLSIAALLLLLFAFVPAQQTLVDPVGFTFDSYYNTSYPAEQAGLAPGEIITGINGREVRTFTDFAEVMQDKAAGEEVKVVTADKTFDLVTVEHPDDPTKGFIGISSIRNEYELKNPDLRWLNVSLLTFVEFFRWLFVLSLGIGLFNLLPLPIVDGGRMAHTLMKKIFGERRGNHVFSKVGLFFLLLLALNLLIPFWRWIISQIK